MAKRARKAPRTAAPVTRGRGRPVLNAGVRPRTITITDEAWSKAESDAETMSASNGFRVSTSQAIDAAVRTFNPSRFKT